MQYRDKVKIFQNVPFTPIAREELVSMVVKWAEKKQKRLVLNMNAYGVVMFKRNPDYERVIKSSDIIYADGWGPVVASWFEEERLRERVNVGDFIPDLLEELNEGSMSLYLIGCEDFTIKKVRDIVHRKYPKIKLVGFHRGYFTSREEGQIVKHMIKVKPQLVIVGMGIPNQELFIERNWKKLPSAVYMGVGGVFYYISGQKSRAPVFMRRYGLEWLYRFFQEPLRLGSRYTLYNLLFFYYYFSSLMKRGVGKL